MKLFLEINFFEDNDTFKNKILIFNTWCNKSLLQLNVKKSDTITFTRKRNILNLSISLGNHIVEKCVKDKGFRDYLRF